MTIDTAVPLAARTSAVGDLSLAAGGLALTGVGALVALPAMRAGVRLLAAPTGLGGTLLGLVALGVLQAMVIGWACVQLGSRMITGDRAGHRAGLPLAAALGLNALLHGAAALHPERIVALTGIAVVAGCLPPALRAVAPPLPRAQPGEVRAAVALGGLLAASALVSAAAELLTFRSPVTVPLLAGGVAAVGLLPGVLCGRAWSRTALSALAATLAAASACSTVAGGSGTLTATLGASVLLPVAVLALLWLPAASTRWFSSAETPRRWQLR